MFYKVFFASFGGITALLGTPALFSSNYKRKLDRNVVRPFRNYKAHLNEYNKVQTEEEFNEFFNDLRRGMRNMLIIEENAYS